MYAVVKIWTDMQPDYFKKGNFIPYLEIDALYWGIKDIQDAEQYRMDYLSDVEKDNPQNVQVIQYDPVD